MLSALMLSLQRQRVISGSLIGPFVSVLTIGLRVLATTVYKNHQKRRDP
jgi:hypothetical protein